MECVVGGPKGFGPYAIAQGWDTVEGVRALVGEVTLLKMEVSYMKRRLAFHEDKDSGLMAELSALREREKQRHEFDLRWCVASLKNPRLDYHKERTKFLSENPGLLEEHVHD